MIIAITGSEGFVGKYLTRNFLHEHQLILIDTKTGYDISKWEQALKIPYFDLIIHLAGKHFIPDSYNLSHEFFDINFNGTLNTLELCKRNNAKMIYFSSYVYGQPKYLPIDENHPVQAVNPYNATKLIGEQLCEYYNKFYKIKVNVVRPFNIYGIGQNKNYIIPTLITQFFDGKIEINDLRPRRDFVFVEDVVDFIEKLVLLNDDKYLVLNIGCGYSTSIKEIIEIIKKVSNKKVSIYEKKNVRENEILNTIADCSSAKKLLNWSPRISIELGITRIINSLNKTK